MIEQIKALLDPFTRVGINKLDGQILGMFIKAAESVLEVLKANDVPQNEAHTLLTYSHIYANVVAVTPYKTTDQWLDLFDDPIKLMFLYTGRNKRRLDSTQFFKYNKNFASLWFAQYVLPVIGCTNEYLQKNIEDHYTNISPRCEFLPQSTHAYFWSDYFDSKIARKIKRQFNSSLNLPILDNVPNPSHIAIITGNWKPTHAVVKSVGRIVYALAEKYKLTLVHLGPIDAQADLSIFKNVSQVSATKYGLDLSEIQSTTFGAALFLDTGLTSESIYLSNMRLAPLQIACHGHPVSGRGNEIDYFLSGRQVEILNAKKNYSENLILLPGSGVLPSLPTIKIKSQLSDQIKVAVPWSAIKYNMEMFHCLKELQNTGAHLVFLPGSSIHRCQASIPVRMSMLDYFGKNITIVPNLPYDKYLEVLANCHFAVDSYPFGGYNTVLESLWCGRPVVTLEGTQWFNRVASYLLRRANMDEVVTTSYKQYTEVAKSLILDTTKLDTMIQKTNNIDFEHLIEADQTEDFVGAIDNLMGAFNE
jgi:hypothetical protein